MLTFYLGSGGCNRRKTYVHLRGLASASSKWLRLIPVRWIAIAVGPVGNEIAIWDSLLRH